MAVAMKAGTAVISTLSQPPPMPMPMPIFPRKKASNSLSKPSYSSVYLPPRNLRFRIVNVSQEGSSQGDYIGSSANDVTLQPQSVLTLSKGALTFVLSNLLPFALLVGVTLGFKWPEVGLIAQKYSFSRFITCWLFFLSGLKSQDGDAQAIVDAWPAFFYGLVAILLLCPTFSKLILTIRMAPQEFVTGTAMMTCMPTTMNGGVALTQLVGGNSALALALTVTSVLLGILTAPLWITKFFADGFGVTIPTWKLFRSLLLILVVPLIIGKVLRKVFPGIGRFVEQNAKYFSLTTSILLGFFPWMQVANSRHLLLMVKPEVFVGALVLGVGVHLGLLTFNGIMVRSLSVGPPSWKSVFEKEENRRALMLVCSQRSVLVATAIVEQLGGVLGQSGLILLPCVAADVIQIIIDSLLVNFWRKKDESSEESLKLA